MPAKCRLRSTRQTITGYLKPEEFRRQRENLETLQRFAGLSEKGRIKIIEPEAAMDYYLKFVDKDANNEPFEIPEYDF